MTNPSWTPKEDELLKKHYGTESIDAVVSLLKPRTKKSIRLRAWKLGITEKTAWSKEDDQFLKENFTKFGYSMIAKKLGRTTSSVQQRARSLGLKKAKPSAWSKEELDYLKEAFKSKPYDEIQKRLKRNLPSIYNKVSELGLSSNDNKYQKLKYNQRLFIVNNSHKMTDSELAMKFGVSTEAIAAVRRKHGIKKKPNHAGTKMTQPEKVVFEILQELQLKEFKYNASLGGYYPDFFDGEKVIEVQGDYFHCNPKLYPDGPNVSQIDYIVRDYYKKCFYKGNGIPVLYLWEHDILTEEEKVKQRILDFCRLGGKW